MMHVSFMGLAVVLNDVWDLRHILPIVVSTFAHIKCNPSQFYYVASYPENIAIANDLQDKYSNLHRLIKNCDSRIVNISHLTSKELQVPILLSCRLETRLFC